MSKNSYVKTKENISVSEVISEPKQLLKSSLQYPAGTLKLVYTHDRTDDEQTGSDDTSDITAERP